MKTPVSAQPCLRFGPFEFNPQTRELRKHGLKIKLFPQAAQILSLSLERPGQICTREELQRQIWPNDTFVDFECSLNKAVHLLRQALNDSAKDPRYIETLIGEGYRFVTQDHGFLPISSLKNRKLDSLAVLPLVCESADRDLEFVNKEIVERVIDLAGQTPGITVLAYSTIQQYHDKHFDPCSLGQDLHVSALAVGEAIQRSDELMLHIELVDVEDGAQLWGVQFRRPYFEALTCPEKLGDDIWRGMQAVFARCQKTTFSFPAEEAA
jgi:DNA-binding winged helix-turn-helix (wHTH) protein